MIKLTDLISDKNLLPNPAPLEAPFISPAISQTYIYPGTTFNGLQTYYKIHMFSSQTPTFAVFGFIVQKG